MLSGDCESPILSGVIMTNIMQTMIVIMFSLGIASAMIGDPFICAVGLSSAMCLIIILMRSET